MEPSSKQSALSAARRTVARPRHDRQLSPNELREYLASLNEKDPSQLMGAVSQGNLIQGLVLATVAATALLLACTIGPYVWDKQLGQPQLATTPAASPSAADAAAPADTAAKAAPAATASPEAAVAGQPAVSKKVMGGVDEVKQSDPNVNPLDSKIDDLFDKTR